MYLIVVYDIADKRVNKVMKLCRQYLEHVQNSVFEGEITVSRYKELCDKLKKIINLNSDSVIIYELWKRNFKREVIGIEKRDIGNLI